MTRRSDRFLSLSYLTNTWRTARDGWKRGTRGARPEITDVTDRRHSVVTVDSIGEGPSDELTFIANQITIREVKTVATVGS